MDRANRLLSMGGVDYQYDGEGRRVQQTVSSVVTKYLLDIQPSLAVVLSETAGANTMRYVHSPRGIHAHKDTGGNWEWMVQDGLGSVREVVDNSVGVLESRNYDPYGNAFGATGTGQTGYGFTGELVDGSGLLDLRARRYNAGMGVFTSLDPFEGKLCRPMSLNGYSWVEGNVPNAIDPSGMIYENPTFWSGCQSPANNNTCSQYWGRDGFGYARCLKDAKMNPCPKGYPVANSSREPYCVDGNSGDFAGAMWERQWEFANSSARFFSFPRFAATEYPLSCSTWSTPEVCLMYHLNFLLNTQTVQLCHLLNRNSFTSIRSLQPTRALCWIHSSSSLKSV